MYFPQIMPRHCPAANLCLFSFGGILSMWLQRIPEIQHTLDLPDSTLGMVLLAGPLGSFTVARITGKIRAHIALWPLMLLLWTLYSIALAIVPHATNAITLAATVALLMGSFCGYDILLNAHIQRLEEERQTRLMMTAHAFFPAGFLIGAGLGYILAGQETSLSRQFTAAALLFGLPGIISTIALARQGNSQNAPGKQPPRKKPRVHTPKGSILWISLLSAGLAFLDGSGADWGGVYMKRYLLANEQTISLAAMTGSVSAMLVRLAGERIIAWFGHPLRYIRFGACYSLCLSILYLCLPPALLPVALLIAFVSVGLAMATPLTFRLAAELKNGRSKEENLADVALLRTAAFTIGPALIGWAAEATTLGTALCIPLLMHLAIISLTWRLEKSPALR